MKTLTDEEKLLLDQLETHADHMNNMLALLSLFEESCPFDDFASLNPEARCKQRIRAVHALSAIEDLAASYHQELSRTISGYYAKP